LEQTLSKKMKRLKGRVRVKKLKTPRRKILWEEKPGRGSTEKKKNSEEREGNLGGESITGRVRKRGKRGMQAP